MCQLLKINSLPLQETPSVGFRTNGFLAAVCTWYVMKHLRNELDFVTRCPSYAVHEPARDTILRWASMSPDDSLHSPLIPSGSYRDTLKSAGRKPPSTPPSSCHCPQPVSIYWFIYSRLLCLQKFSPIPPKLSITTQALVNTAATQKGDPFCMCIYFSGPHLHS